MPECFIGTAGHRDVTTECDRKVLKACSTNTGSVTIDKGTESGHNVQVGWKSSPWKLASTEQNKSQPTENPWQQRAHYLKTLANRKPLTTESTLLEGRSDLVDPGQQDLDQQVQVLLIQDLDLDKQDLVDLYLDQDLVACSTCLLHEHREHSA
jgi:hypothetical protein